MQQLKLSRSHVAGRDDAEVLAELRAALHFDVTVWPGQLLTDHVLVASLWGAIGLAHTHQVQRFGPALVDLVLQTDPATNHTKAVSVAVDKARTEHKPVI